MVRSTVQRNLTKASENVEVVEGVVNSRKTEEELAAGFKKLNFFIVPTTITLCEWSHTKPRTSSWSAWIERMTG